MLTIEDVRAFEVLDSRGNPSVKTEVILSDGSSGSAIVSSGVSTGSKKASEPRDGEARFGGKGVLKAVPSINENIANEVTGLDALNQTQLDTILRELDGTKNYSKLGANAALGVPMANVRAVASSLGMSLYHYLGGANASVLPVSMYNIINGEAHVNNSADFQEHMIMSHGSTSLKGGLRAVYETYAILKKELADGGHSTVLGDESGFAPNLADNTEPIELLMTCIKKAGYEKQIKIAFDVVSTEFYKDDRYHLEGRTFMSDELTTCHVELCVKYPIYSIEDGLAENDFDGWIKLTKKLGNKVQFVGDDLFVTNEEILKEGIEEKTTNAILIKSSQIGTLTQIMRTVHPAQRNSYRYTTSYRSDESEDAFVADFAVALNTGQIKTGAPARADRTAKYNRLFEIELENDEYLGEEL